MKQRYTENIIWFFCAFFGSTFTISNEGMDANRYRDFLKSIYENPVSWSDFTNGLFNGTYGRGDYIEPLLRYITAQFTSDYRVLFFLFGLIFGFFFSRNIYFFFKHASLKNKPLTLTLCLYLVLIVPFWNINGFRFYTAFHIFIYALIHWIHYNKKTYASLFLILAIFTHVSYIIGVILFLLFLLIRKKILLITFFFLSTFLFVQLDLETIISYLPTQELGSLDIYIKGYIKSDKYKLREAFVQNRAWFLTLNEYLMKFLMVVWAMYLLLLKRDFLKNTTIGQMAVFAILNYSFITVIIDIPSMARFYFISYMILGGIMILLLNHVRWNFFDRATYLISMPSIILFIFIQLRIGLDYIGFSTLLYNPLIVWFFENKIALSDLIN